MSNSIANIIFSAELLALMAVEIIALVGAFFEYLAKQLQEALVKG